jgi:hypothetical protein
MKQHKFIKRNDNILKNYFNNKLLLEIFQITFKTTHN